MTSKILIAKSDSSVDDPFLLVDVMEEDIATQIRIGAVKAIRLHDLTVFNPSNKEWEEIPQKHYYQSEDESSP